MEKLMILIMTLVLAVVSSAGPVNLLVNPGFETTEPGIIADGPGIGQWNGFGFNAEVIDSFSNSGVQSARFGLNESGYGNLNQGHRIDNTPEAFENQGWVAGLWVYYDSSEPGNTPATDAFGFELLVTNNWNIHLAHGVVIVTPAMLNDGEWTYVEQSVSAGAANLSAFTPGTPEYDNRVTNRTQMLFGQNSPGQSGTFYFDEATLERMTYWFSPTPSWGETDIFPPAQVTLSWDNPDPNMPGDDILVDVVLSVNSDLSNPMVLLNDAVNAETVDAIGLLPLTTYYWQITAVDGSDVYISQTFEFTTSSENQAPVVDAGSDLLTFLTDGTVDVVMSGSVTDESSTLNSWAVTAKEPADIADPTIVPADALNAIVTLTEPGTYTLTLFADDGEKSGSDEMVIYVGADSCSGAKMNPNGFIPLLGDINLDCRVDLQDFVLIAQEWLENNALIGPVILP